MEYHNQTMFYILDILNSLDVSRISYTIANEEPVSFDNMTDDANGQCVLYYQGELFGKFPNFKDLLLFCFTNPKMIGNLYLKIETNVETIKCYITSQFVSINEQIICIGYSIIKSYIMKE